MKRLIFIIIFIASLSYGQVFRASSGGGSGNVAALTADDTLNVDSGMTADSIIALILAEPRNLGSYVLYILFADGTYTLDKIIPIKFFYNGVVKIRGNISDNSLSTTKAVKLVFDTNSSGFLLYDNTAEVQVSFFDINLSASTSYNACIAIESNPGKALISYNYLHTNATVADCVYSNNGFVHVDNTYVGKSWFGIHARDMGHILSSNNDDVSVGDQPLYGLAGEFGGVLAKVTGTQPTGTTANEFTSNGGLIR